MACIKVCLSQHTGGGMQSWVELVIVNVGFNLFEVLCGLLHQGGSD